MKTVHSPQPKGRRIRAGTPEHDRGLCQFMLMELSQDCSPQGRRRRSELAQSLSRDDLRHGELVLAV